MKIIREAFGYRNEQPVSAYKLRNANGLEAGFIDFGARLTRMLAPDRNGAMGDVVLGFDDLASYEATDTYFGATCGRYGNRIKNGLFQLDGNPVQVDRNEASNHLHGGADGLDKRIWTAHPDQDSNAITFSLTSPDGDQGYPGNLLLQSRYELTSDDRLLITMSGITDQTTILNLVHHSYWNAAGHQSGHILDQQLTVEGDFYTPVDEQLLATGEILAVSSTPFDFRQAKPVGQDIARIENAGFGRLAEDGGGYDHNWVLRGFGPGLHPVATLWDPASGRGVALRSTEPGVQVYTGGYLSPAVIGKGGRAYCKYAGVTFETQKFPGSPNHAHFPSTRLAPGSVYQQQMEIRFFTR